MNFFDKISTIKKWVDEFNEAHLFSKNPENAGLVKFNMFNSSDVVLKCNADSDPVDWITEQDMGWEPKTDYYELEVHKYRKCTEDEIDCEKATDIAIGYEVDEEYYQEPHYVLELQKHYLSKDLDYFFRLMKKKIGPAQ